MTAGERSAAADRLVLISPAIGLSPAAGLAVWKRRLAALPGLGSLAWLSVQPEYDPYKYNSFTTNAAEQVHALTRSVGERVANGTAGLPPMLVLKSAIDATVSVGAVVDRLLVPLADHRNELMLFDINRQALVAPLLVSDPAPITADLLGDRVLPFTLGVVANSQPDSAAVSLFHKPSGNTTVNVQPLDARWPAATLSLSHVALPFAPDDPLYGRVPPQGRERIFLGQVPLQGERGMLRIPVDALLRLRHNPFYEILLERTLRWLELETE